MDVALVRNGDVIPSRAWPTLLEDLHEARVPVLIITGTIQVGNTSNHRAIQRRLGAQVEVFDGATHFIRRDERTRFHAVTDAFIDTAIASNSRIF
jgi:pimeloyl-ACP methyl ester carboxylesterase